MPLFSCYLFSCFVQFLGRYEFDFYINIWKPVVWWEKQTCKQYYSKIFYFETSKRGLKNPEERKITYLRELEGFAEEEMKF